jgi:hypothetical protein
VARGTTVLLQHSGGRAQPRLELVRGSGPAGWLAGRQFTPAGPQGCG